MPSLLIVIKLLTAFVISEQLLGFSFNYLGKEGRVLERGVRWEG